MEIEAHGIAFEVVRRDGCWAVIEPVSGSVVCKGSKHHHKLDVVDQARLSLRWAGPEKTRRLTEKARNA